MPNLPTPHFRALDAAAADALLARNTVGRIAYAFHDRVDIEPISYAYSGGWLYCRTSPGAKLATLAHRPWVAFEVDEVAGMFDWRSVVVHGPVYQLNPDGAEAERRRYAEALSLLRALLPAALRDHDPVPFRGAILGIHVSEMTGREATLDGAP
jgi:hypothetical protein